MWDVLLQHLPLAIILIIAIIICGADLIKAIGTWAEKRKERIDKEVNKIEAEHDLQATLKQIKESLSQMNAKIDNQDSRFGKVEKRLDDLTESDKNNIKSWITEQYQKFYITQGWIDAYSADTIDHRYQDYKKEGGNSFIDTLMERLHSLPMCPPQDKKDK
jgi:Sec-independent protein translocase protein TatA